MPTPLHTSSFLLPTLCAALLLGSAAFGQRNWISNGDFEAGLSGWSHKGQGDLPRVETYDTAGFGRSSNAFAVNPGQQGLRILPHVLSQSVIIPTTTQAMELHCELAMRSAGANADGGTITAKLGGVPIASYNFSPPTQTGIYRTALCSRFYPKAAGPQTFELHFERGYYPQHGRTPRNFVDNVQLRVASGPSFAIVGDRRPGTPISLELYGDAQDLFAVYFALKTQSGIQIPGIQGALELDLATTVFFFAGLLDAKGRFSQSLSFPASFSGLQGLSIHYQALGVRAPATLSLGFAHDYGLIP